MVLLGKPLDFTLRFGDAPHVAPGCNWIAIDPTYAAFVAAFNEAINAINRDKPDAAAFYVKETKGKESVESVEKILSDPQVEFTMTPKSISTYADFMARVGSLKTKPASWKEMFFPNAHGLPGS